MMLEQKTTDFLEVLSSAEPVPGGGGASAAVGAFASALGMMVANLTVGKKKYADVEEEIIEIPAYLFGRFHRCINIDICPVRKWWKDAWKHTGLYLRCQIKLCTNSFLLCSYN